ncbi:MAG: hypothetical protein ACI4N3_05225 [Alphaproteobacteria bacterium]
MRQDACTQYHYDMRNNTIDEMRKEFKQQEREIRFKDIEYVQDQLAHYQRQRAIYTEQLKNPNLNVYEINNINRILRMNKSHLDKFQTALDKILASQKQR